MKSGRPRNFDKQTALDAALGVFWRDGYQGASMADLTAAMGINKPSLYAAFGDKAALYLQALERYWEAHIAPHVAILEDTSDPREALRAFLEAMAMVSTGTDMPRGCLVINCARELECPDLPPAVAQALDQASQASLHLLEARFRKDREAGRLPASRDPQELARYFAAIIAGMGVMAKSGADRVTLTSVIDSALAVLEPDSAPGRQPHPTGDQAATG